MTVNLVEKVSTEYSSEKKDNSVPHGYKYTEIGIFPSDWDVVTMEKITSIIDPQPDHRTPPESPNGEPYIGISDFINFTDIDWESSRKIVRHAVDKQQSSFKLKDGDIVFGKIGTIGVPKFVPRVPFRFALSANVILLQPKVEPYFLMSFFYSDLFGKTLKSELHSTSQAAFGINKMRYVKVPLPPKEEQTAIANALSDVDALIQELEKLITKKQAIKTATMQQLLTGRTRLPQFAYRADGSKKGTKQSELGEIPEDWEVLSLRTASSFINGRAYALYEWETNGTPVIRLQNLTGRGEDYYYSNMQLPEKQYCEDGDLLFMWSATFGPVIWRGPKAIYHYHIWKIICNQEFSRVYMFYLLDDMTEKLKSGSSSGGTMLHVTKGKMETTKAVFPLSEEQSAIANILSDMDDEIQVLEQRLSKTRQIKQGMMQELLTGKTRLIQRSEAT